MDEAEKELSLRQENKPQATWFFERGDGKVFACGEEEAWNLLNNKSSWQRRDFRLIGQSSGHKYVEVMNGSKKELKKLLEDKAILKPDLDKYIETENHLRFKELKDDDDPMIIRVKEKMSELQNKIDILDEQIKRIQTDLAQMAFDAELEVARGNIVMPGNQDIITPAQGDRGLIMQNMGRR